MNCKILNMARKSVPGILLLLLTVCFTSCRTPKDASMFQDIMDQQTILEMAQSTPITVRPGDKLTILVHSKDATLNTLFNMSANTVRSDEFPLANGIINQYNQATVGMGSSSAVSSYSVDKEGNIDFPILGKLHIEGMSRQELAGFIKGELMGRDLIKDPVVTVEFVNTGINILGQVNRPGVFNVNKDFITLPEAIAMAGDVRNNAQRDKVIVMRKEGDKMVSYIVDMTSAEKTMKSPVYYLRQNDIVYVEANDMQKRSTTMNGNSAFSTSFWISVASLLTTIVTTIGVFVR